MPELDSHSPSPSNPTPLVTPLSPWHACGPDYSQYSAIMARNSHLSFIRASCRLAPGQTDTNAAARQWQDIFGVPKETNRLLFANMLLEFAPGLDGEPEGLESITIRVKGRRKFDNMLAAASREGLCGDGWTNIVGVKWYFVLDEEGNHQSKL
jgi:hypothetical protein